MGGCPGAAVGAAGTRASPGCCPALKVSMNPALAVRMWGCGKTPLAAAGRDPGVQGAGLVFSLP